MNRLFLAAQVLTASLFLYSCNSLFPESEEHPQDTIQTIYASVEERPGTRNAIDNETSEIRWTAGDAINVFFGTASSSRFVTEESGSVAKFKGSIDVITGGGKDAAQGAAVCIAVDGLGDTCPEIVHIRPLLRFSFPFMV